MMICSSINLDVYRDWRSPDMQTKKLTPLQARLNIRQYCSYQERSHQEVRDKLFSFGLNTTEVETIVSELISEDFLNEERFACAFARGKFRMKSWGRVKIRHELKQRRISDFCIRKGMGEIDGEEYDRILRKLLESKWDTLRSEKNVFTRKKKTLDYLTQKGFERDLILDLLKNK
jgi:regulatory protein